MLPSPERRGIPSIEAQKRERYLYTVYGLIVDSEIELPELVPTQNQEPDVQVRFGEVPETLSNLIGQWSWCMASSSEFVFTIEGVASYHIAGGQTITIERRLDLSSSVPPADIRLWLLGSAFGALLHQRGLLPLHVSAVNAPSGVWAFTGESGEGKSTLAGFLHRQYGWDLVSDDVSVVDPERLETEVFPGPRKLKLWSDALGRLGFEGFNSVRDLSNTEKFQLYLPGEAGSAPQSLLGLVVLESATEEAEAFVEKLSGMEAFNACLLAVYRPYMESWFKLPKQRLEEIAKLCQTIRVYRFRRPRSLECFERHLLPLLDLIAVKEP